MSENSAQHVLDAISSRVALLDGNGTILSTNLPWRAFGLANGAHVFMPGESENYLTVCDGASGTGAEGAREMAQGIRSVMRGSQAKFEQEYSCNSPTEKFRFVCRVSRFDCEGQVRIVVTHDDISQWGKLADELSKTSATIEMRAAELVIANVELAYQSDEKGKRAAELVVANVELAYQSGEKGKRAAELVVANVELAYQSGEKGKRAAELAVANVELAYQSDEKGKRAAELAVANEHAEKANMASVAWPS
jgi:hypothetical protein